MRKSILVTIIILVLLGVFYSAANADYIPYPEEDSCCRNGWYFLWHIPNSKYCGGGDYYIFQCVNADETDLIYSTVCLSSIQSVELYTVYLPYIVKE